MGFKFLCILTFLSVVLVAHAELGPEEYWKSMLPNTPMPNAVKNLLMTTFLLQPFQEWVEDLEGTEARLHHNPTPNLIYDHATTKTRLDSDPTPNLIYDRANPTPNLIYDNADPIPNMIYKNTDPTPNLIYNHAATKTQPHYDPTPNLIYAHAATETWLHDDPNFSLFFFEKDLHQGKRMNVYFYKSMYHAKFLPRQAADLLPFSSNNLLDILTKLSLSPDSSEAAEIKKTIEMCERTGPTSKERLCATSLESMVDFAASKIGNDVEAMSTSAETGEMKEYNIVGVKMSSSGKPVVVCHKLQYPYAVYYCHKLRKTVTYKVSLVGDDGSKENVVAVCHRDTTEWNPKHFALQVLNVKPGSTPVCHFLPAYHIVWAEKCT